MPDTIQCCDTWRAALEYGTDNEGYSSLIKEIDGKFVTSFGLPAIRFCPWCGADKSQRHPLERAARRVVDRVFGSDRGDWGDLKQAVGELGDVLDSM